MSTGRAAFLTLHLYQQKWLTSVFRSRNVHAIKICISLLAHPQEFFVDDKGPVSITGPALKTITVFNKQQQRLQERQRTLKRVFLQHNVIGTNQFQDFAENCSK